MGKVNFKTILLLLCSLLIAHSIFSLHIVGNKLAFFPGDMADGRLNLYFLEHCYQFFTGKIEDFWNIPMMYPQENVLAYSDNLLGSAPFYIFFRSLGIELFTAYQFWYITITTLNFITAFLLLKYLFKNQYAAILGAFIFAFSLALQSQIFHAQTFPRYAIPLAFLFLVKFHEKGNVKYFFYALLFFVHQLYCGLYLGFLVLFPFGIYFLLILFSKKKDWKMDRLEIKQSLFAIAINILILVPLLWPYAKDGGGLTMSTYKYVSESIPTLYSYFFSVDGSLLWSFLDDWKTDYPAWWDHQIFAGLIATSCFIFMGIWMLKNKLQKKEIEKASFPTQKLFLAGIITFFIFLRFSDKISAFYPFYILPGYNSIRSFTRIINIEILFFALSTAFVFILLIQKLKKWEFVLFLGLFSLLILDNYRKADKVVHQPILEAQQRVEKLREQAKDLPKGAVFSYEPIASKSDVEIKYYHMDALMVAQEFGLRTINAYTGKSALDFIDFWENIDEESRLKWLDSKKSENKVDFQEYFVIDEEGVKRVEIN